ncbi:MAG: 3-deoxy-7-phosphoheptulonate synthase class II [Microthrixaceae bacterium]
MTAPTATGDAGTDATWSPSAWRDRPAAQQPEWHDPAALAEVTRALEASPPLVIPGETRRLAASLADVANGRAFLLQAGDCAESFDSATPESIERRLRVILQMAIVLTHSAGVPVVKLGRIAGQYAKPRSSNLETIDDVSLPSFRGHIVNLPEFEPASRTADPRRILEAYRHSATTLNLLRAMTQGGYADLAKVHQWNEAFVADTNVGRRYETLAGEIDRALRFMEACGLDTDDVPQLHEATLFASHEGLILDYEEALTRLDPDTGEYYDTAAHSVWIGERTRDLDGAHVRFFSGIANPIGTKVGPTATPDEVVALCEALDPQRTPGRLTLIARMGADKVADRLGPLVEAVHASGHPVIWATDPMHGNTFTAPSGRKTRHFDAVEAEIKGFFDVHRQLGTWPGGIHVELTGDNVTECLGGSDDLSDEHLGLRYETMCDPRLNARQSVDLAFRVAELLRPQH